MNGLSMLGITHRGAPLSLLERVTVRREERPRLRATLRALGFGDAVLLCTCSRVEIYLDTRSSADHDGDGDGDGVAMLLDLLAQHSGATREELARVVELRTGQAVVTHLFEVTAGLQSRLLGEVEILAQAQSAFRESQAAGMTGPLLGRLFPAALRAGRQVHGSTSLGGFARSLGHQAVDVGLASLGASRHPKVLVVGSGQMARAAVDHLTGLGIRPAVAARDEAYAARLAGPGAVCPLPSLTQGIAAADLLICTTSAAQHVVGVNHVSRAMADRVDPLTVVDLSVPRNVEADVADIPGVTLINVEGLADEGSAAPAMSAAISTASAMAGAAARQFGEGVTAREAGPVIAALRHRVEDICRAELERSAGWRGVDPDEVTRLTHTIAGKLLHRPTIAARQAAATGDVDGLRQLCEVFGVLPVEVGLTEPVEDARRAAG